MTVLKRDLCIVVRLQRTATYWDGAYVFIRITYRTLTEPVCMRSRLTDRYI